MSVLKNFQLTSGLFLVLFVLSDAMPKRGLEISLRTDSKSLEEIQDLLRQAQFELKIARQDLGLDRALAGEEKDGDNDIAVDYKQCNCSGAECSCCRLIRIDLRILANCCIKMTYEQDKRAILVSLTLGSHALPPKEVSVSVTQPPPIDYNVQKISWLTSLRIEFHSYKLKVDSVNGCLKFNAKTYGRVPLDIEIGCFQLALRSTIQHAGEVEPLYFEDDIDSVEGAEPIYPW